MDSRILLSYPFAMAPPGALVPAARLRPRMRDLAVRAVDAGLALHPRTAVVTTCFGAQIRCNTSDLIQRTIYEYRVWEPGITAWIRQHVRADDVVVDVGANIGYDTLLAASLVGDDGRVDAVEPSPALKGRLQDNLRLNPELERRVRILNVAAAAEFGDAVLHQGGRGNSGRSSTRPLVGLADPITVPAAPLHALVREPERVRLIKVDVEGDELSALRGLLPTLQVMRAGGAVVCEITPRLLAQRAQSKDDVYRLLQSCGFEPRWAIPNVATALEYAERRDWSPIQHPEWGTDGADVVFVRR